MALARALAQQPKLLLLDEPFAALDSLTRIRMQTLVKAQVEKYQPGVLLVTHDVDEAITLSDWLSARKVLPEPVHVADHLAAL